MYELIVLIAGVIAGAVASIAGFGIGSILTPLLSLWIDARLAVAAVSIPHLLGTALRFWILKGHVDRRVLWSFGLASAAGGVLGAALQGGAGVAGRRCFGSARWSCRKPGRPAIGRAAEFPIAARQFRRYRHRDRLAGGCRAHADLFLARQR